VVDEVGKYCSLQAKVNVPCSLLYVGTPLLEVKNMVAKVSHNPFSPCDQWARDVDILLVASLPI
jgi:hypothetical protein